MKNCLICACLLVSVPLSYTAMAQSAGMHEYIDAYDEASHFMYGFDYLSNYVYLGRRDTATLPYYSPYIGYHLANGLEAKATASYTTTGKGRLDLVTVQGAYDRSFSFITAGAYADKYFYNEASNSVRSTCKAAVGMYVRYNNDLLEPRFSTDLIHNAQSGDLVLGFGVDHKSTAVKGKLTIVPMVNFSIGQRHYYNEYLIKGIEQRNNLTNINAVLPAADKIVPLVYELSIDCNYVVKKWIFMIKPTYSIPKSPGMLTIFNRTFQETLNNVLYLEIDVRHE